MLLRMVTYMKNHNLDFKLAMVPEACCWTEGPGTVKQLFRQRTRWARGLFEIVSNHRFTVGTHISAFSLRLSGSRNATLK